MVVTYKWPALALPLMLIMYVYLFAVIIDVAVMWHKLKKKLIEKFGEQSVAKGMRSGSYAWSRAIQIRRWSFRSLVTRSVDTGRSDRYREPPVIFQAVSEQLTAFHYHGKRLLASNKSSLHVRANESMRNELGFNMVQQHFDIAIMEPAPAVTLRHCVPRNSANRWR